MMQQENCCKNPWHEVRKMAKVSDPFVINGKTVKNRITFAPTVKFDFAVGVDRWTIKPEDNLAKSLWL